MKTVVSLLAFLWCASSFAQTMSVTNTAITKEQQRAISDVIKCLDGHFSNKKQSDTTTNARLKHQEFVSTRIWKNERPNEYWVYMGWFAGTDKTQALAERVIRIYPTDTDTLALQLYVLPEAYRSLQPWINHDAYDNLADRDLIENCAMKGFWQKKNEYRIVAPDPCEAEAKIKYHSLIFDCMFSDKNLIMYHTYFDAKGEVLFRYPQVGNVFDRK